MPLRPAVILLALPLPAMADAPSVVADIAPVHSIAARVMEGIGEPTLLIPPGVSPHAHTLRPSEAGSLQSADLVFRIGDALTPGLGERIDTLSYARVVVLSEAPGVTALDLREDTAAIGGGEGGHAPDHGAEEASHDDHDHGEKGHEEAAAHDDHEHGDHDHGAEEASVHAGHDHHGHHHAGGLDPHLWLDPANASAWAEAIAGALSEADPDNAEAYAANAEAAVEEFRTLAEDVSATLEPVAGQPMVVFHDAYQYFEEAFGLEVAGAISVSDAAPPSPSRLAAIRDHAREVGAVCIFAEPQFDPGLVAAVAEGADLPVATLDPLGAALEPGPDLYPALLMDLAEAAATCTV